jgi:hypothetical protein
MRSPPGPHQREQPGNNGILRSDEVDDRLGLFVCVSDGLRFRMKAAWSALVCVGQQRWGIGREDAGLAAGIVQLAQGGANAGDPST